MSDVCDYSWARPGGAAIAAAPFVGVMRYISNEPGKDISAGEWDDLKAHGLPLGLVFETTANAVMRGAAGGDADARQALARASALGYNGALYFAIDFDAGEGDPTIHAYFAAAAAVVGHARTGAYGGIKPLRGLFNAGLLSYGWQTLAWSRGLVEPRACLYQDGRQGFGGGADYNTVRAADWGQHGGAAAAGPPPPAQGRGPITDTVHPAHPVAGRVFKQANYYDWNTLTIQAVVPAGTQVEWSEAKFQEGQWWDRISSPPGPMDWMLADAVIDDGGFDPTHFAPPAPAPPPAPPQPVSAPPAPIPAPTPTPTPPGPPAPPQPDPVPAPVPAGPPASPPVPAPITPEVPLPLPTPAPPTPAPVAGPPPGGPMQTPVAQTPWYRNSVVWSSYISTAAAFFFAVTPWIINVPGLPRELVTAIGVISAALIQLGYQNHSAIVRAAELAPAAPPSVP